MANLIPGMFATYAFENQQEELQSDIIQPYMMFKLQNELSAAAEEIISLRSGDFSPEDMQRRVIYLHARIDFIKELIAADKTAKEEMENIRQDLDQQPGRIPQNTNLRNLWEPPSETQNAAIDFNSKPNSTF